MTERPFSDLWVSDKPKIVWDGLGLSQPYSGIGYHAQALHGALLGLGVRPLVTRQYQESIHFLEPSDGFVIGGSGPLARYFSDYTRLKLVFPSISYKHTKKLGRPVIYHGLSNLNLPVLVAKRPGDRYVVTIHDVIPLLVPTRSLLSMQMRFIMPRVLDRADAIIAISSWTKDTLLDVFGQQWSAKITIINNGFDNLTPRQAGGQGNWVLTVARGESYKRLELIKAIASAKPDLEFHVVTDLTGEQTLAWRPPNVCIHVGISSDKLDQLYTNSRVMIHPSRFEGWCLPAAEALSRGLNLVYCSGSGIDEVCRYFPNQVQAVAKDAKVEDWIDGLEKSMQTPQLKLAKEPMKLPDWHHVSLETLKIYQNLL